MNSWCTIESDPAVFEEMIHRFGAENVAVGELLDLDFDAEYFKELGRVFGFIFLFKWVGGPAKGSREYFTDPNVFFARQVVQNACATQAILSVLFNNLPAIKLNEELTNLAQFSEQLDPTSRGMAIGESPGVREIHNSFARQDPFQFVRSKDGEKEDAYHFVGFVFKDGKVLELDGLQEAPIALQAEGLTEQNWMKAVLDEIRSRAQTYAENEIRFTLLVLSDNQQHIAKKRLEEIETLLKDETLEENESNRLLGEKVLLEEKLEDLARQQKIRTEENERRKHDYMPLIFALLEETAKTGQLESLLDAAEEKFKPKST